MFRVPGYCAPILQQEKRLQRARKSNYKTIYSSLLHLSRSLRYLTSAYLSYPRLTGKLITVGAHFLICAACLLILHLLRKAYGLKDCLPCPRRPKLTQLNLGPRSLAGLIIHSKFLLLWFCMPGMPIVKPVGLACPACRA